MPFLQPALTRVASGATAPFTDLYVPLTGSGSVIPGDVTITGDLTVDGGISAQAIVTNAQEVGGNLNLTFGPGGQVTSSLKGYLGADQSLRIETYPLVEQGGRGSMSAIIAGDINLTAGTQTPVGAPPGEINVFAPGDVTLTAGTGGTGDVVISAAATGAEGNVAIGAHNQIFLNTGIDGNLPGTNGQVIVSTPSPNMALTVINSVDSGVRLNMTPYSGSGAFNSITQEGDAGLFFGTVSEGGPGTQSLTIAPWIDPSLPAAGLRIGNTGHVQITPGMHTRYSQGVVGTFDFTDCFGLINQMGKYDIYAYSSDGNVASMSFLVYWNTTDNLYETLVVSAGGSINLSWGYTNFVNGVKAVLDVGGITGGATVYMAVTCTCAHPFIPAPTPP